MDLNWDHLKKYTIGVRPKSLFKYTVVRWLTRRHRRMWSMTFFVPVFYKKVCATYTELSTFVMA